MKSIFSILLAVFVALGVGACKGKKAKPFAIGKITTLVPGERQLWVDEGKKTREYYWDTETKVVTEKGPANIDAIKAGDKVKLSLKVSGGKNIATEIEVKQKKEKAGAKVP
jgi:hypothetical protein